MIYKSKTVDISKVKRVEDIDTLIAPWTSKGYDVKAITKDFVILTKQTAN